MSIKTIPKRDIQKLKPWLDAWVNKIERPDPVMFMHAFDGKTDRELAGFFAALMAWGRRDIVINKVRDLLSRMNHRPAEFIGNFSSSDAEYFDGFKHRTFKPVDIYWLATILKRIVHNFGTFEHFWQHCNRIAEDEDRELLTVFPEAFFSLAPEAPKRTRKHISDAGKNSSCKRLCLYLRWCIRRDSPVDPGIMDFIPPSKLKIPLDVHVARQARVLGLISRTYNDWKSTNELTKKLQLLDPGDPAKYDYALFGLGVSDAEIPENLRINPEIRQ